MRGPGVLLELCAVFESVGARMMLGVGNVGRFGRFFWQTFVAGWVSCLKPRTWPLIWVQMNIIGVQSVPVVMLTGAFVGATLAIQVYDQLALMGLEERMGQLVGLSVVKELGPVLTAVMLAGRVGGALTAELGTMNVTEQIDAVRSMGTNPIRYLVAPRVMACLLLTPLLIIYADLLGIFGGYAVSVWMKGINAGSYWSFTAAAVELWDVGLGIVKGFFFGVAIAVISCYKGFHCREGAEGVGQACTEAFVASFISILALNLALAMIGKAVYATFWPLQGLL